MGKRIEDLPLDDTPINQPRLPFEATPIDQTTDVRETEWYQFVGRIDDLLASDDYTWAFDTLTGIKETVEHTRRVSDGQRRAIDNIERQDSRRYDGYYRRQRF